MVQRIEHEGWTAAAVTAALAVSNYTVRKWLARWRAESSAGLENRSSRLRKVANRLAAPWIDMAVHLRREFRLTAAEIGTRLRLARSTIAAHLAQLGVGRLARFEPKPPVVRFQRDRPGDLLHLGTKLSARFERVGHRITGDRKGGSERVSWKVAHVAVVDARRLACAEVLPMSAAAPQPASWFGRCAGSGFVVSLSSA